MSLKTKEFDFNLPEELIASEPLEKREEARMLVFQNQNIEDKKVVNILDYLNENDLLVFNNTKVIKAKLSGKRDDVKIEINLHKKLENDNSKLNSSFHNKSFSKKFDCSSNLSSESVLVGTRAAQNLKSKESSKKKECYESWQVMAKPAKRLKIDQIFKVSNDFYAKVLAKHENGFVDLEFNCSSNDFYEKLEKYGEVPLPPYIKREQTKQDEINYQTIFAKTPGAVAAPTAGLHFTDNLFKKIDEKKIKKAFVTLNVGAGTFLPVKSDLVKDHEMHSEYFTINQETCDLINKTKKNGGRVIAVGTTSLRVLESAANENNLLKPMSKDTDIFIFPPYKFKVVDILMTNFHLPKSTLFMLISAFVGRENALQLYKHAIKNKYRFYSYGDACLLFNKA